MIDKRRALPLHYQVLDSLRRRLMAGEWSHGQIFPPDKHWVETFGVSITTVRHALNELAREGWLLRQAGKGTFVQTHAVASDMGVLTDIFAEIRLRGARPSAQLIRSEKCEVGEDLLKRHPGLERFESITLFMIELLQCMDSRPVCLIESYWPLELGREILKYDFARKSLHEILDAMGVVRDSAEQVIRAEAASRRIADHLELDQGAPVLVMERLFYSGDRAVEYSIHRHHAADYSYELRLGPKRSLSGRGILA